MGVDAGSLCLLTSVIIDWWMAVSITIFEEEEREEEEEEGGGDEAKVVRLTRAGVLLPALRPLPSPHRPPLRTQRQRRSDTTTGFQRITRLQ